MPALEDPIDAALAAGLRYIADDEAGIVRRRRGKGFSYRDPSGAAVAGPQRERISALAVPPAWSDVWICVDVDGHIQTTGRDDLGRKQYRYHDRWRAARDADRFEQLLRPPDARSGPPDVPGSARQRLRQRGSLRQFGNPGARADLRQGLIRR